MTKKKPKIATKKVKKTVKTKTLLEWLAVIGYSIILALWILTPVVSLQKDIQKTRVYTDMSNAYSEIRFALLAIENGRVPDSLKAAAMAQCVSEKYIRITEAFIKEKPQED